MSLISTARDALKDLPVSDIVRERLSLALDRLAEAEAKIETLQSEKGSLQSQLERERLDHQQTRQELQRLKDEHAEEIRIHRTIEFRRGKRTGGKWMAFCPKCHLPVAEQHENGEPELYCIQKYDDCGWRVYPKMPLDRIARELDV